MSTQISVNDLEERLAALVVAIQKDLHKEKDLHLAKTSEVHHSIQSLERRLKVQCEEGDEAVRTLVVATQQELAKEKDMRSTEAIGFRRGLQTLEGCFTQHLHDLKLNVDEVRSNGIVMHDGLAENLNQMKALVHAQDTLRLRASHEMDEKVSKLGGELEVVQRKCAAAHDEIIALTTVVKNSIDGEKVRQEKTDIETQINNVKRELTEERGGRINECSMLKRLMKNLEEQLSTHVKQLRFNHEAEVNERSMAHEKLEQTHRELKGGLDAHDANHLEALTGLKNMLEQEIKAREKDCSNIERTFSVLSARFDTETSTTSRSMHDLRNRLNRLCDELEREVQDRAISDANLRELVVVTKQELGKEKDIRLAETSATCCNLQSLERRLKVYSDTGDKAVQSATQQALAEEKGMRLADATEFRRGLQALEGCLTQHLHDLKLNVDEVRSNGIVMHDGLAENLNQMKAAVNAQETLRHQATHEMHDKLRKLNDELEAVRRECLATDDEITALTMVMKYSIEKENVQRKNADNHINIQIDHLKQELIEQRGEYDNECSMLKLFMKNLEEQLSTCLTDVEELRFNHETEVNKQSMAYNKLEKIHHELEGALDAHDANLCEALTGLKKMIEQEIKARENDTSNTERTFSVVTAQFGIESSMMSQSMGDLSDRLKRLSHELGTEVQDRAMSDADLRALVVATQQELDNLKDMRFAETNATLCNLQSLEGRLMVNLEKADASVRALVVATQLELDKEKDLRLSETNETRRCLQRLEERRRVDREDGEAEVRALVIAMHQELAKEREMCLAEATETHCSLQSLEGRLGVDLEDGKKVVHPLVATTQQELLQEKGVCLAETIELQQGFERRLELLREGSFPGGNQVHDEVQKLGGELVAMQKESAAADEAITKLTTVMKNSIEKERVEWEKTDNENRTQINNIQQGELTEETDESENDTSKTGTISSPLSQALDTEVRSRSTSWSTSECSQSI